MNKRKGHQVQAGQSFPAHGSPSRVPLESQLHVLEVESDSQFCDDSFSCSDVPVATHFSPINFDYWPSLSETEGLETKVSQFEGHEKVGSECEGSETESAENEFSDVSPERGENFDYRSIKYGEPGFYKYGACYFPGNWSKRERTERRYSMDICATSAVRKEMYVMYEKAVAKGCGPTQCNSPGEKSPPPSGTA